ncbi:MAG: hypothetical protein AAGB11_14010 [Pseudomonadota bacterium]
MLLVAILCAFLLRPDLALVINRAVLAFLLVAVWVPFFTLIARVSHKVRLPIVVLVLSFLATALFFLGDNHLVRTVPTARGEDGYSALVRERPHIEQWIAAWKRANCASDGCPAPILIAASGGASRAGFFTESALGRLMDATCPDARK